MNSLYLDKRIKQLAISLAYEKGYVCAVDMLLKLEYLKKADYELWRFGKIVYLEKACTINFSKLSRINKTIKQTATELKLEKSWTCYKKYGKGNKGKLLFTRSGDEHMENDYATHYVDKKRIFVIKMNSTTGKAGIDKMLPEDK